MRLLYWIGSFLMKYYREEGGLGQKILNFLIMCICVPIYFLIYGVTFVLITISELSMSIKKSKVPAILVLASVLLLGCTGGDKTKQEQPKSDEKPEKIKEVMLDTESNYVFKKIYVTDHLGWTHEILVATSGNTMGGVEMLELSVYPKNEESYGNVYEN